MFLYQNIFFSTKCFCCASKGYTQKIKRNDFMGICNGRKNSLWWNDVNVGGCPLTSGPSMAVLLSKFYLDLFLILSKSYPDKIRIKSGQN